jgi:hypothetical protein
MRPGPPSRSSTTNGTSSVRSSSSAAMSSVTDLQHPGSLRRPTSRG